METTFIMIKPDGVQRGLVGQIIARFEARGYHLRAMKFQNVSKEQAEEHYADLKSKPFFGGLVDYIIRLVRNEERDLFVARRYYWLMGGSDCKEQGVESDGWCKRA